MEEFTDLHNSGLLVELGKAAGTKARQLFLIQNNILRIEAIFDQIIQKAYGRSA